MSVTDNKILVNTAERLGLQSEINVIRKADEFNRVLLTKTGMKSFKELARLVLCLDMSSSYMGIGFDKETAVKLSGLRKSVYQNNLNILEKILEIDRPLTIKEVCVQLSCTNVLEAAEKIFELYKEKGIVEDLTHPQYVAVVVYTACKLNNVKVQKSKFVALSRLKPTQWKDLELKFDTFCKENNINVQKKTKSKNEMFQQLEQYASNQENSINNKMNVEETVIEDYEIWKMRILTEAKLAINSK